MRDERTLRVGNMTYVHTITRRRPRPSLGRAHDPGPLAGNSCHTGLDPLSQKDSDLRGGRPGRAWILDVVEGQCERDGFAPAVTIRPVRTSQARSPKRTPESPRTR